MNNSSKAKSVFVALCAAVVSASATAGVCKIGNTEYDTFDAAVAAVCNGSNDATITLTADINITAEILVSAFPKNKTCTIDGDGHLQRERDRRQRHERDAGAGFAPLVRRRCCRKTGRFPAKAHAVSARGAMLFIQSARTHESEGACPRLRAGQTARTGSNEPRGERALKW